MADPASRYHVCRPFTAYRMNPLETLSIQMREFDLLSRDPISFAKTILSNLEIEIFKIFPTHYAVHSNSFPPIFIFIMHPVTT